MAGMSGMSPQRRRIDVAELRRLRRPSSIDVLPRVATSPALLRRRNTAETPSPRGAATPSPSNKAWCLRRSRSEVLPTFFHFHETGRLRGHGSAGALGTAFLGSASPASAREGERRSRRARRTKALALALAGALAVLLILGSAPSNTTEPGPERAAPSAREEREGRRTRGPPPSARWEADGGWTQGPPREARQTPARRLGSPRIPRRAAEAGAAPPARGESKGRRTQGPPREAPQPPDALLQSPPTPRRAAEEGAGDGIGPRAVEDLQEADDDYDYAEGGDNDYDYAEEGDNDYDYGEEGDNDYDYSDYDYGNE